MLAESMERSNKEIGIRTRKLKVYWERLGEMRDHLTRDVLLKKLDAPQVRAARVALG